MGRWETQERVLLVGQASRPRYSRRRRAARRSQKDWEALALEFEQNQDYQQLLARVLALSARFQASLSREQRQHWLELEEALLDHSWLLHGEYFRAGFELGRRSARNRRAPAELAEADPILTRRSQAALVEALLGLIQQLAWPGR
jgi:hypothetical protein